MSKRKTISPKTRFEIFKRDKFTCQYCGSQSPDIILEIDHIVPVSKGGNNDILNLITSCKECNRGKSNKSLDESNIIHKQKEMLNELGEKQNQLDMLIKWKKELLNLESKQLECIYNYIYSKAPENNFNFSLYFKNNINKLVKKYNINDIFKAIDISAIQYLKTNQHEYTAESIEKFLGKIGGILYNLQNKLFLDEPDQTKKNQILYLYKTLENKFKIYDRYKVMRIIQILLNDFSKSYREMYDLISNMSYNKFEDIDIEELREELRRKNETIY